MKREDEKAENERKVIAEVDEEITAGIKKNEEAVVITEDIIYDKNK